MSRPNDVLFALAYRDGSGFQPAAIDSDDETLGNEPRLFDSEEAAFALKDELVEVVKVRLVLVADE